MKKILMVLTVILMLLLVGPMFLPSHFSMSRTIEIQAPVSVVFRKLTNLNEYVKWNPFPEGDPSNKTQVTGIGAGSYLEWSGEKTGDGKMTIDEIDADKKITIKMDFYKPMKGKGVVQWITQAKSESVTEMTWTFEQNLDYFTRYFGLLMDSMMGKHFEKGLLNYKTLIESGR